MITNKKLATYIKNEKGMQCNCDLDNWQPTPETGHSVVCRIHKAVKSASPELRQLASEVQS